jgi:hypothetical protein
MDWVDWTLLIIIVVLPVSTVAIVVLGRRWVDRHAGDPARPAVAQRSKGKSS